MTGKKLEVYFPKQKETLNYTILPPSLLPLFPMYHCPPTVVIRRCVSLLRLISHAIVIGGFFFHTPVVNKTGGGRGETGHDVEQFI